MYLCVALQMFCDDVNIGGGARGGVKIGKKFDEIICELSLISIIKSCMFSAFI